MHADALLLVLHSDLILHYSYRKSAESKSYGYKLNANEIGLVVRGVIECSV